MAQQQCPFKVGDTVIFTHRSGKAGFPGEYGLPKVGDKVTIIEIFDGPSGTYVRWQGMQGYPGGGLHWTEFSPA
jgi:hypothetical protein